MLSLSRRKRALGKGQVKESESYLSLGSNLGDRIGYLNKGIDSIARLGGVALLKSSQAYETDPVGVLDQPPFLNMAAGIVTSLAPEELLAALKEIETSIGRIHRDRWREREIDIDIIFYDGLIVSSEKLAIPHERAHLRRFVLKPLADIAPEFEHPILHETVAQLLAKCPDNSGVRMFMQRNQAAN